MDTLINDERAISTEQLQVQPHARILTLAEAIPFLVSPDSCKPLQISESQLNLTDGEHGYPIVDGTPVLYPANISEAFLREGLELNYYEDSKLQYFLLSQIKQRGEINAASTNVHYQRHLFRMKEFLKDYRGAVLDVGCDNVEISAALFNKECCYIGLDPFSSSKSNFRVIGVGEFLPIRDESVDNVVFNTSLDHILDYHQAINEAFRVLRPGGILVVATLIWQCKATLLTDSVHFHHFRDYEVIGALNEQGKIIRRVNYSYKIDNHRYEAFFAAEKFKKK